MERMKLHPALRWLVPAISLLALIATGAGLFWPSSGQPYPVTTLWGETVMINGRGLYQHESLSMAAQAQAQDLVTLLVGLPLLLVSAWLAGHAVLRGGLLLTGTLGYFLYTYTSLAFGAAYNPLFLVYVALFSLSLFAFVLSMMSFDLTTLPQHFSDHLPRRSIAALLFVTGGFLLLAWLGRIAPSLFTNQPPVGLGHATTLFIQVLDLGLIVPLALLAGWLLLRRSPWGYLLASVAVLKFLTMGLAVSAMGINMLLSGVEASFVELTVFFALTVINVIMAGLLLKHVKQPHRVLLSA